MNKNKFLLGIANKVANLLTNQANQNQFKKYSHDFQKKRTAYKKAIQQWSKKKWKGYNDASGQELLHLDPKRKLMTGRNAILPTNRKEQLWRSYIWLIIIHDWQRPSDAPIDDTTDEPLKEFKGIIENILTDTGETHPVFKQENESGKHYIESALADVKADPASKQQTGENKKLPTDLISTCVAVQKFFVSRATLKRNVKDGELKSYRPSNSPKNQTHIFSEADIASRWPRHQ